MTLLESPSVQTVENSLTHCEKQASRPLSGVRRSLNQYTLLEVPSNRDRRTLYLLVITGLAVRETQAEGR